MFVTDISVLVVAKIGCENVQLKFKLLKVFVADISIFSTGSPSSLGEPRTTLSYLAN